MLFFRKQSRPNSCLKSRFQCPPLFTRVQGLHILSLDQIDSLIKNFNVHIKRLLLVIQQLQVSVRKAESNIVRATHCSFQQLLSKNKEVMGENNSVALKMLYSLSPA